MSILKCLEFHDLNDERSALFAGTHNIGSGNTALILYAYINPIWKYCRETTMYFYNKVRSGH